MNLGTLSVVEMGLSALGLPYGKGGVQAAVDYLAKSVPPGNGHDGGPLRPVVRES
jgi:alanine-glyoxylate transaminase/serine-glyoxylate transaminase/serine-pyruvate transaminase